MTIKTETTPALIVTRNMICEFLRVNPGGWSAYDLMRYTGLVVEIEELEEFLELLRKDGDLAPGVPIKQFGVAVRTYRVEDEDTTQPFSSSVRFLLQHIDDRSEKERDGQLTLRLYVARKTQPSGWVKCRFYLIVEDGRMVDITHNIAYVGNWDTRRTDPFRPSIRINPKSGMNYWHVGRELEDYLRRFAHLRRPEPTHSLHVRLEVITE